MKYAAGLLLAFFLYGCASTPTVKNMKYQEVSSKNMKIVTWTKNIRPDSKLRIYIEGDAETCGLFKKKACVENPVALKLAEKDTYPNRIYLSRPCYYTEQAMCNPTIWREGRFLPEIIDEMKEVVDIWRRKYRPTEIEFIGYDGGGAIALLLAARMKNGTKVNVITVAGTLNTELYSLYQDEPIYAESLNPASETYALSNIPQTHYIGGKDEVYPNSFSEEFVKKIPNPVSAKLIRVKDADHTNWDKFSLKF